MPEVVLDCTELLRNPVRTGVQRVVRELIRHWPAGLRLARFDGSGLVPVPDRVRRLLIDEAEDAGTPTHDALLSRLADASGDPAPALPAVAPVLIPELFHDTARAEWHVARRRCDPAPLAVLVYDFLPFLRPDLFRSRVAAGMMDYLRLLHAADARAFISEQTRTDWRDRIARDPQAGAGPVLPLGADGLRMERQAWHPGRRHFVALGQIDGRKNQQLVVAAFVALWQAGHTAPLTLIGWCAPGADRTFLHQALAWPQFRWLGDASDAQVAAELRTARATVFASTAEGFGLPPVESLHAGIPAVAWSGLPSLAAVDEAGLLRLDPVDAATIAAAVLALQDDAAAQRLWDGAATQRLPGWSDFARRTAEWVAGLPSACRITAGA